MENVVYRNRDIDLDTSVSMLLSELVSTEEEFLDETFVTDDILEDFSVGLKQKIIVLKNLFSTIHRENIYIDYDLKCKAIISTKKCIRNLTDIVLNSMKSVVFVNTKSDVDINRSVAMGVLGELKIVLKMLGDI